MERRKHAVNVRIQGAAIRAGVGLHILVCAGRKQIQYAPAALLRQRPEPGVGVGGPPGGSTFYQVRGTSFMESL